MLSRLKFDLSQIINEKLTHIPNYIWESKTTTFCDLQMAGGQYIKEIVNKLREFNHSDENIKSRVFGFSENEFYLAVIQGDSSLIGTFNVYKENIDMKFDCITINPPYESKEKQRGINGGSNKKLWKDFLSKSISLLKEDGHLIFLSPTSWANGAKNPHNNINIFNDIIKTKEIIDIDMNAREHFPKQIGTDISCIILQNKNKTKTKNKTLVNGVKLNLNNFNMLPKNVDSLTLSIFNKCSEYNKFNFIMVRKDLKSDLVSNPNKLYKYQTYTGKDGIKYTKETNEFTDKEKVIIHRMNFGNGELNFVFDSGNITPSYSQIYLLDSNDRMDSIKSILNSKIIKFLYTNLKYTQYNEARALSELPKFDTNKIWNDVDIYNELNLTDNEINIIESYVK